MRRIVRIYCMLMIFALSFAVICIPGNAAETTEKTEPVSNSTPLIPKTGTPGWKTIGLNKYYYDSNSRLVTGWYSISGKYYYFLPKDQENKPAGSMVTGFQKINNSIFYFHKDGYMLSDGWTKINKDFYYLTPTGDIGVRGAAYIGKNKIDGNYYFFNEDGSVASGWIKSEKETCYGSTSTKISKKGILVTGWKKIGKNKYNFNKKGTLQTSKWIENTYYVNEKGKILKKAITPDGYYVNSSGEKSATAKGWKTIDGNKYYLKNGKCVTGWKTIDGGLYYFDENGVRQNGWIKVKSHTYYLKKGIVQTGWQEINNKRYYFDSDGKMAVNTKIDGYPIGADGVAGSKSAESETVETQKASILIIAGHGQGDVGAIGYHKNSKGSVKNTYYEYKFTREFASIIKAKLDAVKTNLTVRMYDQNYDCYQVNAKIKSGPDPEFKKYDYVLEIHFNATVEASKDPKGNGSYKGIGMYVNSAKSNTKIDQAIVKAAASVGKGFKIWGGGTGIMKSSGLLNARTCQGKNISYGLLETAFIDDYDDVKFYKENKEEMGEAVAKAIINYFK